MAKNFMSSILDELMGRDRNALPDEQPKKVTWDDPEMCSHYLVCFCPHELFVNTKADLGPCPKLHDEQMRKKYQEDAPNNRRLQFEAEFIRFAEKMVQDIEAKIKRGKMRIALANGPDGGTYAGPGSKNAEKIALLTERINVLLKEAEEAGCEGDIEKAQGLLKLCDQLKEEREQMKSNEVSHPWNPDKAMQVCEVCGSYLIIGEAQHRLDDHIMGKQHMGFAMLRKTMEDVKKAKETREKDERERIERERRDRRWGSSRDIGRGSDRKSDRREKSRSRSRDKKKRDLKDEKRKRSKSRSPRRRSRDRKEKDRRDSKDDRKRDSSRDRDRKSRKHSDDKRRSRRSRSRSRDRHHRRKSKSTSRSKEKDRERSHSRKHKEREKERDRNNLDHKDKEKVNDTGETSDTPNQTKSPKLESPRLSPQNEESSVPSFSEVSSSAREKLEKKDSTYEEDSPKQPKRSMEPEERRSSSEDQDDD